MVAGGTCFLLIQVTGSQRPCRRIGGFQKLGSEYLSRVYSRFEGL